MQTKAQIVRDWLPRYTGLPLESFPPYILLTNFSGYVERFAKRFGVQVADPSKPMQVAATEEMAILNFGMGSATAATAMDLLSAAQPKAALFLGKCGGLKKKSKVGDFVLPLAAIRGEGTSNDYMPPEVPALPSFSLHEVAAKVIRDRSETDYWTGTVYTTNRRVWEHDEDFKKYLAKTRAIAVDMETATIFTVGFANAIPRGALLLVSDNPMVPEGVKTSKSDRQVTERFVETHIALGVATLEQVAKSGKKVKHLRFE